MPDDSKPQEETSAKQDASSAWVEQLKKKAEELLLSWGPTGLILGLAVHFGRVGLWKEAAIALVGAGAVAILTKFYTKLEPKLDKLFGWVADNFEGWVLKAWWTVTAQFQGKYYKQLVYNCRDFRTQGLKTKGAFTLNLEKVFVPLRVAPESADKISSDMMRIKAEQHRLGIWDFLAEISKQPSYQRIVIIGPPGSGKTTLLEHLTLTYAQNAQRRQHRKAPALIPVLIYLRTVRDEISGEQPPTLAKLIAQQPEISPLNPNRWFEEKLGRGRCLVMLDGLDEVADEAQRRKVSLWIDRQMRDYPKNAFVLTSRPFGYRSAALEQIGTVLEMQQFSLKQTRQFIQNWYLQNEIMSRLGQEDEGVRQVAQTKSDDLINRIQNMPTLATMALNPLLLTMIATVHCYRGALPGRRVELYGEICDVLLGRRQDAKGISDPLTVPQKQSVLQGLALALMQQPTREFTPEQGCALVQDKLRMVAGEAMQPAVFLKAIANQTGLLVERERGIYEFVHKSFQEYLAAVEVKDTNHETLLTQQVSNGWWFETIRLYAAQGDASQLIEAALEQATVPALTLAVDCLEEGLSVQPSVRATLEERLEQGLESTDPDLFKLAAEVKLAGRLNRLLRIDDCLEIDKTFITCAEYQLFIDAKRKIGSNRQPDHWTTDRFLPGDATKPIAGVRASDAEEFCQWLSEQEARLYRLPQSSEVREHPSSGKTVGCWCMTIDGKRVEGISQEQSQSWQRELFTNFDIDLARDRARDRDLARDLAHALTRDLACGRALDRALDRDRDRALTRDLARDLARDRDLARAQDLDRALTLTLDRALTLARALDRDRDRALTLDRDQFRRSILLIALYWDALSQVYEKAMQSRNFLRRFNQNRRRYEEYSREYARNRDTILRLYWFFALTEQRRAGSMPAWEGIRIVRETQIPKS